MSGLSRRLGVTVLVGAWAAAGSACVPGDEAEAPGPEVSALPAAGRFPAPSRFPAPTRASVFYIGYDDRYQQTEQIERDTNGDGIDDRFFFTTDVKRTNRAVFTKLQYLFRY